MEKSERKTKKKMNMVQSKALVAKVLFGEIEIDGLMLPDGTYAIATSQLEHLNLARQTHGARDVKALLGKEISLAKYASELNSNPVVIITIEQLATVIKLLSKKGNKQ